MNSTELETAPLPDAPSTTQPLARLRVGPAVVLVVIFWAFVLGSRWVEMAMFTRFISRWSAYGLLLLLFLGWWLSRRQLSRGERFGAFAMLILGVVIAGCLADSSVNWFVLVMMALPIVFSGWTAWLLVSRNRPAKWRRLGMLAVTAATFAYFTLVRWDGLNGAQQFQMSWRWTPSPEALFLEANQRAVAGSAPVQPEAAVHNWVLQPGDWPEFRGPQRDAVVLETKLDGDWKAASPRTLWRQRVGPGWSSMIVVDGRLVTQEQRGPAEAIVCYDAETGRQLWAHEQPSRFFEPLSGAGPRSTPTFHEGRIYGLGASGVLVCVDAAAGKRLWMRDLVAQRGAEVPQWGYSGSPLAVDDRLIVFAGGERAGLLAYSAASGQPAWSHTGGKLSYSSPQLASFDGQRQILMHDNRALAAVNPEDGALLWERLGENEHALPTLQPRPVGSHELLYQADAGIGLLEIHHSDGRWTTSERWTSTGMKPSFNDVVVYENHVYGLDDGILCCLDLQTGKRLWKKGRYGHGQILLVAQQGTLLVLGETGEIVLVAASPKGNQELGSFKALEGKTWNHPVIAHDRLFVRNGEEMACYDLNLAHQH